MSADNGVYIAKFPDGYRVAYAMAIDNIDYFPKGSTERKEELKSYFGKSQVFPTKAEAFMQAQKLADEVLNDEDGFGILEYGISYAGEYEAFNN